MCWCVDSFIVNLSGIIVRSIEVSWMRVGSRVGMI